jgi:hypothetical protein
MSWFRRKKKAKVNPALLTRAYKLRGRRIRELERDLAAAEAALEAVKEQCDKRVEFAQENITALLAVFHQAVQVPGVAVDRTPMNFEKWASEFDNEEEEDEGEDTTAAEMRGLRQRINELYGGSLTAEELHARRRAYDEKHATKVGDKE